ncbi:MAG TPA: hypothetical protein VGB87_17180 [Vicinamibacteria bacterium]
MARAKTALVALAAALLLGGCATTYYSGARVVSLPSGHPGKVGGRSASFDLEGLKVRLDASGEVAKKGHVPRVSLRIRFDPPEIGWSFDPGKVVVRDAEGRTWPAAAAAGYRPLVPGASFDLSFDVLAAPDSRLTLVIDGIARGARPLDPVALPIGPKRWGSIERLYWLEAIGYALAAS